MKKNDTKSGMTPDAGAEKKALLPIQYLLYERPLYHLTEGKKEINVLIVGFGVHGQQFLDACLQAGQMIDKTLNVLVITDNAADKKSYLSKQKRPELAKFFNIDDSLEGYDESDIYGNIVFEVKELSQYSAASENDGILRGIVTEYAPSYMFIAYGDEGINSAMAEDCKEGAKSYEGACTISYVCKDGKRDDYLYPVDLDADHRNSALYPEIERMAFNTHLIWEKSLNVDYSSVREDFREPYNYHASIANVLSLKYKLQSIGIALQEHSSDSFEKAAQLFTEKVLSENDASREIRNQLIWMEHRRWVTEKLCLGWSGMVIDSKWDGVTKDKEKKRHVCILRSRADQMLADEFKKADWDTPDDSKLAELDELDRMSVEIHRWFADKAEALKKKDLFNGNNMRGIRLPIEIEGNRKALMAFQEWISCLKDIWNGNMQKVYLYESLKSAFLDKVRELPQKRAESVCEELEEFEKHFYPVLASMEYRDWKQDDVAMVDNIPFILTYSDEICLVIPYEIGDSSRSFDNSKVFGNVAVPTMVNPKQVQYICLLEEQKDVENLQKSLSYVIEYMEKKKLQADVKLCIAYKTNVSSKIKSTFDKKSIELSGRKISVDSIPFENIPKLAAHLKNTFKGKIVIEKNKTALSARLQDLEGSDKFYSLYSNYQFDSTDMGFSSLERCGLFRYIKKRPHITVTDMAAFKLSSGASNQPEFFADYEALWKMYYKKSSTWKFLCKALSEHPKNSKNQRDRDLKVFFNQNSKSSSVEEYSYKLPVGCKENVTKIIEFLKKYGITEQESGIREYTTDYCEAVIIDRYSHKNLYNRIFSQLLPLMLPDAVTLDFDKKDSKAYVILENREVSGFKFPIEEGKEGKKKGDFLDLMKFFETRGDITNLSFNKEKTEASFTYATKQIKELLTVEGKILEVYTYHKAKEVGKFDDVVSSFEINWEETDLKNEFDCIITKGFRTLFVECKATWKIDQNYYSKLYTLVEQFGINATAVLVDDTQEEKVKDKDRSKSKTFENDLQEERGKRLHIVTVRKKEDIWDIGNKLLEIIEKPYEENLVSIGD